MKCCCLLTIISAWLLVAGQGQKAPPKAKKVKLDFNTQMGQCRACVDECGMEAEKKCESYYRQVAAFHVKNMKDNKLDIEGGEVYTAGCVKKGGAIAKGTVVKLCCMGSGVFQDQKDLKIDYNPKKDSEVIEKAGTRVKLARCIMCNSQFQDVFSPDSLTPSKEVCPPAYVFGGRMGVSDKEQLASPAEAKDYKEVRPSITTRVMPITSKCSRPVSRASWCPSR